MRPDPTYLAQTKEFWAHIRTISQQVGYTQRGKGTIKVPTLAEIRAAFLTLGLSTTHIVSAQGVLTPFGQTVLDYFAFRAHILNTIVQRQLMDGVAAKSSFIRLKQELKPRCPLPMNKRKLSPTGSTPAIPFRNWLKTIVSAKTKSRKPSDSSSGALPEAPFLLIDRCAWSRRLDEALRSAGIPFIAHHERFADNLPDEDWLPVAGSQGWIVITRDNKVIAFVLASGNASAEDTARLVVELYPKILRKASSSIPPAMFSVTLSGGINPVG